MEAALDQLTTKIFSLLAFALGAYILITLVVHKGLDTAIPSKQIRNGIIKLLSIAAFAAIVIVVLTGKH